MADEMHPMVGSAGYVLGHNEDELQRLANQARLIDPITFGFLRDAGIERGMRVLDVGCGVGHVAFLAAELVGPSGEVLGVDRSEAAVASAKAQAESRRLSHVSFRVADPAAMTVDRPFDAVVGRYVLQFQPDPAEMLRAVAAHARPGGAVVFHELDWRALSSAPPRPTYDLLWAWANEALRSSGAKTTMGLDLYATFVAAGLTPPRMRLEARVAGGAHAAPEHEQLVDLVQTLAPIIQRLGLADAVQLNRDLLLDQLASEAAQSDSVILSRLQIGAWTQVG